MLKHCPKCTKVMGHVLLKTTVYNSYGIQESCKITKNYYYCQDCKYMKMVKK